MKNFEEFKKDILEMIEETFEDGNECLMYQQVEAITNKFQMAKVMVDWEYWEEADADDYCLNHIK